MMMIKTYDIRPFTSVALNRSAAPQPQADPPLLVNVDEIDIADGQVDKFMDAAKAHAAASVQDPGCREFNIAVSQTKDSTCCCCRPSTTPRRSPRIRRATITRRIRRPPKA